MNETMNYIFGKLRSSEIITKKIANEIRRQKNFNRNIKFVAVVAVYYAISAGIEQHKQAEKIENLEREIEKLKSSEGE